MLHDIAAKWGKTRLDNIDVYYYILTRFNLPWPDRYANEKEFADWSECRLKIFFRYCAPAIKSQTVKPHRWYVLFDETFEHRRSELLEMVGLDYFEPIFVPRTVSLKAASSWFATERLKSDATAYQYSMGMRLDSDDTYCRSYVAFLDDCLTYVRRIKSPPVAFNFPYQLRMREGKVFAYVATDSASLALWERSETALTPYAAASHTKVWEKYDLIECATRSPMVIMHGHDNNIGQFAWRDLLELANGEDLVAKFFTIA